jgi:ribosome-associated translation inhibitor RaiA
LQVHTKLGLVQVVEMDRDVYAAIDLACERLQRTLARLFDRQHFQNNGGWRTAGLFRRRYSLRSTYPMHGTLP